MVHKEKGVVELVSSFREGARTTFGPERQYVNMPISLDLWHQFTREIRRIMPKYATKVIEEHPNGAYVAKLTKVSANGDIATSYVRVGSITELLKQTNVRRSQAE